MSNRLKFLLCLSIGLAFSEGALAQKPFHLNTKKDKCHPRENLRHSHPNVGDSTYEKHSHEAPPNCEKTSIFWKYVSLKLEREKILKNDSLDAATRAQKLSEIDKALQQQDFNIFHNLDPRTYNNFNFDSFNKLGPETRLNLTPNSLKNLNLPKNLDLNRQRKLDNQRDFNLDKQRNFNSR